jgi:hypothetical protein
LPPARCLRRARGRGHVEQHRGEAPAHVPLQIIGQHSEQDVRAHPWWRGPMEHWTQFEIDGLQRAEGVLDAAETFVGAHRGVGRQPTGLSRGGIGLGGRMPSSAASAASAEGILGEGERIGGDADLEMLGHVAPSQHCTECLADRRGAVQWTARPRQRAAMRASSFSVTANSSARLPARSSASNGFLQTTRRSPG